MLSAGNSMYGDLIIWLIPWALAAATAPNLRYRLVSDVGSMEAE
jgi:hypothetical protein